MPVDNYVDDILYSPVYVFDEIIEKILGKNLSFTKIELSRCRVEIDVMLVESIKSILKDLNSEEGLLSRFIYAHFGLQFRKNKRREQLIYLGSELKTQYLKIKKRLHTLENQKKHLHHCMTDLERLRDALFSKNMFFEDEKVQNKSKFYMNKIEKELNTIEEFQISLLMRYNDLLEVEKIYHKLFIQIPRYHELREETYLLLLSPIRK